MKLVCFIFLFSGLLALPEISTAHSGGLNSEGCHNNRQTGSYHCHRKATRSKPNNQPLKASSKRAFRNCSEARAAGAAPVKRGEAGYGAHLDRDNDGIGCE